MVLSWTCKNAAQMRGVFLFRSRSARRKAIGSKKAVGGRARKPLQRCTQKKTCGRDRKNAPRCVAALSWDFLRFRANLKCLEMNSNAQRNPPLSPSIGAAADGQSILFLLAAILRPSQNDRQKTGPIDPRQTAQPLPQSPQANQVERREPRVGRMCR